jgi:hypothetical protein
MISAGTDLYKKRPVPALSSSNTTIALTDCRWYGHHPTYFRAMCRELLRAGYRVLAICPAPDECNQWVREDFADDPAALSRFHAVLFKDPPQVIRLKKFDHDPVSTERRWRELARAVNAGQRESGWKADLVFFCWLDSFLRFAPTSSLPNRLGIPWSGLYFRNHHLLKNRGPLDAGIRLLKGDRLLSHRQCRAVGLLDERPARVISERYGIQPVLFPDITNEAKPTRPSPRAKAIREEAGDRMILGMISLEPRKGLIALLRIADECRDRPWFWVFTGPYEENWLSGNELELIRRLKREADAGEIDHLHLDLSGERISDGEEYNGLMDAFDVVLAVYPGWQASSNALTKAAVFEKRVLAWEGGCVGPRVRDFQLGLGIDPDDVPGAIRAIECLERGTGIDGKPITPRFEAYRQQHSLDQLGKSLVRVIEASLPEDSTSAGECHTTSTIKSVE